MFTGLIEASGAVLSVTPGPVYRLQIGAALSGVKTGDSVAVNGVCLTLTGYGGGALSFDAVRETVSRTTLAFLKKGERVNLETALTLSKPLGGHFVSGHVDGLAVISAVRVRGDSKEMDFTCPRSLLRYIAPKGSVALDGISLTVARVTDGGFSVAVIPHTLSSTTLEDKRPGDRMNLETDILAKYTEKLLGRDKADPLKEALIKSGFVQEDI
ncbi:MAG: riboflavin synthase [Abditibacteriota bacterium]|nr:riboflavin synthase [Abditibacteriota bacterium]